MSIILKLLMFLGLFLLEGITSLMEFIIRMINKTFIIAEKVILLFIPIVIYSLVDHQYNITPRITLYIMGVIQQCLNFMSTGI